jgi:hypothetical protein
MRTLTGIHAVAFRLSLVAVAAASTAACRSSARSAGATAEHAPIDFGTAGAPPASLPVATTALDRKGDLVTAPAASAAPAPRAALGADEAARAPTSEGDGRGLGRPAAKSASLDSLTGGAAPTARMAFERALSGPSIAAGEWDDNANYREFMRYLANEEALPLHRVDLTDRRFLVVRDVAGKPVPRCRVTVVDERQHQTTLTTTASGRAILFPHAEGLAGRPGGGLTASASCMGTGAVASRSFALDDQDGAVDLRIPVGRELAPSRSVDVAFILDTTGSMGEEIDAVRSTIGKVARELGRQNYQVRLGLVEYKDRGDVFVTKVHPFSSSSDAFLADVAKVTASGGGDLPESVNEGLHVGLSGLEWSRDSVGRFAFLIGDAPPHLDYANDADYAVEMKRAAHEGIQIFTVAASGMDAVGQAVFRQVASYTGATNLFVLRGGAGPQSTGAGDPKSSCGGTQTSYSSGNLDALILGKIRSELRGLDGDAMRIAGLYQDEDAKPCSQRVALAD